MYYNVVFEYEENNIRYGIRTWSSWGTEVDYQKFLTLQNNALQKTPIALNVTPEEAINLCSQTPEICRIVCAIKQTFAFKDTSSLYLFFKNLTDASSAIYQDRQLLAEKGIKTRPDARKYLDSFNAEATSDSFEHQLIKIFLGYSINNFGQIRLEDLMTVSITAMDIFIDLEIT